MKGQIVIAVGKPHIVQKEIRQQVILVERRIAECIFNDLGRQDHDNDNALILHGDLVGDTGRNEAEIPQMHGFRFAADLMYARAFIDIECFKICVEMFEGRGIAIVLLDDLAGIGFRKKKADGLQ